MYVNNIILTAVLDHIHQRAELFTVAIGDLTISYLKNVYVFSDNIPAVDDSIVRQFTSVRMSH